MARKKKAAAKTEAVEADKKNVTPEEIGGNPETTGNDPKAEEVKEEVDKSASDEAAASSTDAQDASNSKSDTNTPDEENNASTATESADPGRGGKKGSGGFQVYPSAKGEPEEISDDEVQSRDQEQAVKYNKLKAVAYNRYRDTKFTKLPKRLRIDELTDLEKLPAEVSIDSEILMDNGQIYTLKDQLTQKFNKDALISI